jgi:hypothetical protein
LLQGKWVWFKKLALKAGTAPVHSPTTQKSSPRFCGQRIQQTFCMSLGHFDTPISWVYPILSPILGRCSRTRGAWQIAAPHSVTRDLKSPQNDLFFVLTSDFESTIFPDFSWFVFWLHISPRDSEDVSFPRWIHHQTVEEVRASSSWVQVSESVSFLFEYSNDRVLECSVWVSGCFRQILRVSKTSANTTTTHNRSRKKWT